MVFSVVVPNGKFSPNLPLLNINLIICSLFTLIPNDDLFKELNVTKYYSSTGIKNKIVLIESKHLNKLFLLLNRPLVRQLAYNILQPLLQESDHTSSHFSIINSDSSNHQALTKYLKKFNYFYKLFFLETPVIAKSQRTEKEINFLAIKFLFFLIGI